MNRVELVGNLARDPEIRNTQSRKVNARFTLAINRRKNKDGVQEADFIACTCWDTLAENVGKYLSKGRKAAVCGRLQTRSYEAQDGSKRFVTEVLCDSVEFLSPAGGAEKPAENNDMVGYDDEELPF